MLPPAFRGPMAAAVEAALAAAHRPQPELTVAAVLAGMAAACAGNYRMKSGLRLNLYTCGVAETGAGKELPRQVGVAVAIAGGARVIGKPASGQGLEDELQPMRGMLSEVDEVAHLFGAFNSSKAPAYLIELAGNMLKLFSASQTTYHTRVKALVKGAPQSRSIKGSNPLVQLTEDDVIEMLLEELRPWLV